MGRTGGDGKVMFVLGLASLLFACTEALEGFVSIDYAGNEPVNWGHRTADNRTCFTGKRQSPVNIGKDDIIVNNKLHDLQRVYVDANATLINTGISVMLKFEKSGGFMTQDGKNYTLKQLHWHSPSEHTIDKKQFPLELHMVHVSEDGDIAAVAILYDIGYPDPFLHQLKDAVTRLARERCTSEEKNHLSVGRVHTKAIKRHSRKYYKYAGSLTTPPCTENVTWYILGKVRKVSKDQITLIKSPLAPEFRNNARPTQPLNGRKIELYCES